MVKSTTKKAFASKLLAVLMTVLLLAVYIPTMIVGAATTTIKTVDDLKNISKNLSGTYVLGANIDCKGASLSPIGNLKSPFTGKFSCPTGANGKPTYAITNVTISVNIPGGDRKAQQGQYKKDGDSQWCAGLFGATCNATFKNIIVLNANISSNVIGGSSTGSSYSETYKGMDEQSTGILVGTASGTSFTGCGVTGTVKSISNNVGGFVGFATKQVKCSGDNNSPFSSMNGKKGSTFTKCYAAVSVNGGAAANSSVAQSTWGWNIGGFVGCASRSTFTGCAFDGTTNAGYWMSVGAFAGGTSGSRYTACYATGSGSSDLGAFASTHTSSDKVAAKATNCYSNLKIGATPLSVTAEDLTGNFLTPTVGSSQEGFAVKSVADINAKFAANTNWQTYTDGSTLPTVKGMTIIKSLAELDTPTASSADSANSKNSASGSSSDSASGENSSEDGLVKDFNELSAEELVEKYKDFGITQKIAEAIVAYRDANGSFSTIDDLKNVEGITDDIIDKLQNGAEITDGDASGSGSGTIKVVNKGKLTAMTTAELILIIVLSALIVLLLAGSVVTIVLLVKKMNNVASPIGAYDPNTVSSEINSETDKIE